MRLVLPAAVLLTALASISLAHAADALRFESTWLRATPAGADVGAGYATLRNDGEQPRRIVAISAPVASEVQVHSMHQHAGMMQMREATEFSVPAHGSAKLAPGADHLMLLGLKQALVKGQTVPLEFKFDDGSTQRVDFAVRDTAP